MIQFHKILKSIFQNKQSCPKNKCTENWRELPNLTSFWKFSYTLGTTILYNMCKKLRYSIISKVKQSFRTASGRSSCFEFWFWFISVILLPKMKSLFFSLSKFAKPLMSFLKAQISFLSNFALIFGAIKHISSVLFWLSNYIL